MIKCIFHLEKLNAIDTVCEKHILLFSRPACCGILTWQNLKGLAELAAENSKVLLNCQIS